MNKQMTEEVLLELKDINKRFGSNHIHRGVSFKLYKGQSIGLLGGSGSGKSVLLREIIGLEHCDSGEIYYRGKRIDTLSEEDMFQVRIHISYSFQSGALFDSFSVYENIGYPLFEHTNLSYEEVKQKVDDILKLVDLEGKGNLMPSDLSGGMQKRVGMARSMIMNPDIILYDEPTAGLDPKNTQNVVELMRKLKDRGHASIFVTHDIPAALALCDKLMVLHDGVIALTLTPKEFEESDDPILDKFKTQQGKVYGS